MHFELCELMVYELNYILLSRLGETGVKIRWSGWIITLKVCITYKMSHIALHIYHKLHVEQYYAL